MSRKFYNVGKIINTHGIHGEVKVFRITDFPERFKPGNTLYLVKNQAEPIALTIDGHRFHQGYDLLHFAGLETIDDVESFKGGYLKVSDAQLHPLDDGEYYYHEIIGCHVYTRQHKKIGIVKEILTPGANDVWVVEQEKGKDILIPYIDDVVKHVDTSNQTIMIEPMEGLLD